MSVTSLSEFKRRAFNALRTHVIAESEYAERKYRCQEPCCGWTGDTHGQFNDHLADILTHIVAANDLVTAPTITERLRKFLISSPEPFHTPAGIADRLGEDPYAVAEALDIMPDVRPRVSLNPRLASAYRLTDNGLTLGEEISRRAILARDRVRQFQRTVKRLYP